MPHATDGHGWTTDDSEMMPLWYEGNCLPSILVDDGSILDVDESDTEEQEEDEPTVSESDSDYDY
jgi:hypothetical protein